MGRLYSQDLRERVLDAAAVTSRRQAVARFGVSVATAIRWMTALTTTGTVAARPQGQARRSKLDPNDAFLLSRIAAQPLNRLGFLELQLLRGWGHAEAYSPLFA